MEGAGQGAAFGLTPGLLQRVFPFHIVLDRALCLMQVGHVLQRVMPELVMGAGFGSFFSIQRPVVQPSFEAIVRRQTSTFMVKALSSSLLLRGEVVLLEDNDHLLFLCEPSVTEGGQLKELGLRRRDFAMHSPTADFLLLLQSLHMALKDNERLVEGLRSQTEALKTSNRQLRVQSGIAPSLATSRSVMSVVHQMLREVGKAFSWPYGFFLGFDEVTQWTLQLQWQEAPLSGLATIVRDYVSTLFPVDCLPVEQRTLIRACLPGVGAIWDKERKACIVCVPVCDDNRLHGALAFVMECGDSLEGDVAQMLTALGQQLGLFIRRTQVDDELERARREAENANYTKSLFLANMSHELRTPLNAIIGYSELILEEELPDSCAFVREDVDKIHSAGEYLLALVDNVLALSKLEADSLEFDVEEFELGALVQELSSMFASAFQLRNNTLLVEMPKESVTLTTDRWKVQQVLSNLLSNACKYTSGGNVSLRFSIDASRERDWLVCVVEDNGRGIEESAIPLIFSAYTNFDISARGSEGSGLGLALCKRFCELLRGTIEVESKFGVGTRFCVQIPVVWPGKIRK